MNRATRRALALLLPALAPLAVACSGYRVMREGEVQPAVVDTVTHRVAKVRQLDFVYDVPVVAVGAEQARAMLQTEIEQQYEPGELAELTRVYRAFGLLPADADLETAFLDLYGQEIAGFYDPIERRMVLVDGALATGPVTRMAESVFRRDFSGELVLAHELTHALQDQHFGLDVGRSDLGEGDAQLARRAVYEGDAILAGYGVTVGRLTRRRAVRIAGRLEGAPAQMAAAYPDIPALIRETTIFQYVAGANFTSWAYKQAGWDGVNALLSEPPRSTEQVLHPEKYFVKPEHPLLVHVGGLTPYLKDGWMRVEETTLGELVTRILGEQFLPADQAATVAAGWHGDRLVALTRHDEISLIWLTVWDSVADAREFFDAYQGILTTRLQSTPSEADATLIAGIGQRPYRFECRGTRCLAIEGHLDANLDALADRIWRRSRYEASVPFVPLDLATVSPASQSR